MQSRRRERCGTEWCVGGLHLIRTLLRSLMDRSFPSLYSLITFPPNLYFFLYFCYSFSLTLNCLLPWFFSKPFIYIQHPVPQMFFIASLESSSPAVRADTGFWFVWKVWSTDLSDPSVWCQGLLGDWDFVWPTRWRKRSLCWRSH